jgi:SAM-dependent methyltransferase
MPQRHPDIDAISAWFHADRPRTLTDSQAIEAFHLLGSRCRFFKTLPAGASVLDIGAGDGALHTYREWPLFHRRDLSVFAYAGERGANFDRYDGFEIGLWPQQPPVFPTTEFMAIQACNFIEHIDDPLRFVRWTAERLAPRGRLYLEWPRPIAASLPTTDELRAHGIDVMTGNYFDDATHRLDMPLADEVMRELSGAGVEIEAWGIASVPFVDGELASASRATGDIIGATMAYWSFTEWCQYIVGVSTR